MNEKYLPLVVEEAGEVLQMIGKIQRFGIDSSWKGEGNLERLCTEVGDLLEVIYRLDLPFDLVNIAMNNKIEKLKKWGPERPRGNFER